MDELRKDEDRGEGWGNKIARDIPRRYRRCESVDEIEHSSRLKRRSGNLDELEEEGEEEEDLEEGYTEDKEVLREVLNFKQANFRKKKAFSVDYKNDHTIANPISARRDLCKLKLDYDSDEEEQVELLYVRRTIPGAWSRPAGSTVSWAGNKSNTHGSFGSRSSISSNFGGIGSATRNSLSHRGSISETVAALAAHRSSLSSSSLLCSRNVPKCLSRSANTSFTLTSSSSARKTSVNLVRDVSRPPGNRKGSGLSLTSLGFNSNLAANSGVDNLNYTGGLSLDSSEEFKNILSGNCADRETYSRFSNLNVERKFERFKKYSASLAVEGSGEERFDDDGDGAVTRLLENSELPPYYDGRKEGSLGSSMLKCTSWVSTKVSFI